MKQTSLLITTAFLAAIATSSVAGTAGAPAPLPTAEPFVTGSLSLAYNTHFISYGQDIWNSGNTLSDSTINPSAELVFDLGSGLKAYLNAWADVNNEAVSDIGGDFNEVDLGAGFYYTKDKFKYTLGYGAWMYGKQIEHIVDLKVAYSDGFWNPFLMLHGRVGDQLVGFDTGLVAQVGISPGTTLGPVSLSFPVAVSFDTDGFHGGDSGFAYASVGVGASYPLSKKTSLNLGATYYYTSDDVIPSNPDEDFVTGSAGISFAF